MKVKTRKVTLSALFSALCFAALYVAAVWPTGLFGLVAFSSLFVAAAVVEMGAMSGVYVFIVSSALGMIILPDRAAPLLFIMFFGYYPIVKSLIERLRSAVVRWILKLAVFNASLSVLWFLIRGVILGYSGSIPVAMAVYLLGSAVFAVFDYGYSKVIWFYINRVSKAVSNRKGTGGSD